MFRAFLLAIAAIVLSALVAQAAHVGLAVSAADRTNRAGPSRVGMNLAANTYYATEFPFIDRMKSAGDWVANGAREPLVLTPEGYPVRIPAGAKDVYVMVGLDPKPADYVLTYQGGGGFFLAGAQVRKQSAGRIEFHYAQPSNQMLVATGNVTGLRNVRIFRKDHEAQLAAGEIFNPAFIDKIRQFDTLRYMDWVNTNGTNVSHWADRTPPTYRTWQTAGDSSMPVEVMVALANQTKTNMWLNVPTKADDDYVRRMVTYVHDHLDPSLSVQLEYSNEVWNWGFQQAGYSHIEAAKLWGQDANRDGKIDPYDKAEQYGPGWVTWYGYRSAQIAKIAHDVFGADANRLHGVIATQTVYQGLENMIFDGVARARLGSVDQLFDDYAVTAYFDGMLRGGNDADRATILSWARGGDAGMTAAFAALRDEKGLTAKDEGSLAWLRQVLDYQDGVARKNGLTLVAYEGCADFSAALGPQGEEVAGLFRRMQADPRMGGIYTQMVGDFGAAGGTLLNVLIDVDAGLYGHLKTIYDTGSPSWDALVAAQKAAASGSAGHVPLAARPNLPGPARVPAGAHPTAITG